MASDPKSDSSPAPTSTPGGQNPDPAEQAEPQTVERNDPAAQAEPQSIEFGYDGSEAIYGEAESE